MRFARACIPLGGAWSSPFVRWQGPLAELSSLDRLRGGGVGLFSGCAAGDSAAAIVLRVDG